MSSPPDTRAVSQAIAYAAREHGSQTRTGTRVPYLSHLLAVTTLVMEHGGTTDQCVAAALHDVVEDCGGRAQLEKVRSTFGDRVAGLVEALSDAVPAPGADTPPWHRRKRAYLRHLAELVAARHAAVLVSACDKTHNAEAIVLDATDPDGRPGLAVFDRFGVGPADVAWYYRELGATFADADLPRRLTQRLARAVERVGDLAARRDG